MMTATSCCSMLLNALGVLRAVCMLPSEGRIDFHIPLFSRLRPFSLDVGFFVIVLLTRHSDVDKVEHDH